jgi:hypothetical protein
MPCNEIGTPISNNVKIALSQNERFSSRLQDITEITAPKYAMLVKILGP